MLIILDYITQFYSLCIFSSGCNWRFRNLEEGMNNHYKLSLTLPINLLYTCWVNSNFQYAIHWTGYTRGTKLGKPERSLWSKSKVHLLSLSHRHTHTHTYLKKYDNIYLWSLADSRISAKLGNGQPVQLHTTTEPILFTFGKSEVFLLAYIHVMFSRFHLQKKVRDKIYVCWLHFPCFFVYQVPKGLEMGIGTMSRGEKAVIYVTSQYLSESPLIPSIEGVEEVHFEVELIHFIQVWN